MQRRMSEPMECNQLSALTACRPGMIPQALNTTTTVFPEFTPSSTYDKLDAGFYWSHYTISRRLWEYVLFLVALITPIEISYVLLWDRQITVGRYSVFFLFDVIQIVDIFVILKTPFLREGIMIGDMKDILKHYGYINFIIHIVGSLPLGWIGIIKNDVSLYGILSINRLLRLHQGYKSYKLILDTQAYQNSIANIVLNISLFVFVTHVFACVFYLIALSEGLENSWVRYFHLKEFTREQQYAISLYFVLTTILTIGFGDIHPVTSVESIVAIVVQAVGVFFEGFLIAKMVSTLADPQARNFLHRYETIRHFLKLKKIDKTVRQHVRHYHQHIWDTTHGAFMWNELFHGLPVSIKNGIKLEICNTAFSRMKLFFGVRQKFLLQILDCTESLVFMPGQYIYTQGDISSELLILKSGLIQIIINGESTATQETGSLLIDGERQLLFEEVRTKTLKAISFVEGWRLKKEQFGMILNSKPTLRRLIFMNAKRAFPNDFLVQIKETDLWPNTNNEITINEDSSSTENNSDEDIYLYVCDEINTSDDTSQIDD